MNSNKNTFDISGVTSTREDLEGREAKSNLPETNAIGGMKVLMISTDRNLFFEESEVRQRNIEYGGLVKELHIVVFNGKSTFFVETEPQKDYLKISEDVFLYPTNSFNRWLYVFDAARICKKIIIKQWQNKLSGCLIAAQDPFECGWVGRKIRKRFKIPLQIQVHTDFFSPYFKNESLLNQIRVFIAKFIIHDSDFIRVVSARIKQALNEQWGIAKEKIMVFPIFVDVEKIRQTQPVVDLRRKYPQFGFIILIASRFTGEKNIFLAIKAFKDVVKKDSNAGLIIVGDGPKKNSLESAVRRGGLSKNVIIEKWTDDLVSYYKTADLFLLTSNYEGYGRTVVEAMAAGCPVVMTDVGLAGELVRHDFNGLVVPPLEAKKMKDAILLVINNPSLAERFVVNSYEMLKSLPDKEEYLKSYKYSWEAVFSGRLPSMDLFRRY